jgi:Zn-dependent protease
MLIELLFNEPITFIILAAIFMMALTFHEFAHAYLANHFGDPTPRLSGRLTLNPLAHLDPIGTLLLFFVSFGWAKPVPIESHNFKRPIIDEIQVALAGPFANLLFAVVTGLILRFIALPPALEPALVLVVILNINLMVFNLLPIPPLDGSHLLKILISEEAYWQLVNVGPFILLGILIVGRDSLGIFLETIILPLAELIIGR